LTAYIAEKTSFLSGLSKPLRNARIDEISKRVNKEIDALGSSRTFADLN
jgi:hypothetical protein